MRRIIFILILLGTLTTISCTAVRQVTDTVQDTIAEIRDEPEPSERNQRQESALRNRPFWLGSIALLGIAFCAIAAMVLSSHYV